MKYLNIEEMELLLVHFDIKKTDDIVEILESTQKFDLDLIKDIIPNLPVDYDNVVNDIVVEIWEDFGGNFTKSKGICIQVTEFKELSFKEKTEYVHDKFYKIDNKNKESRVLLEVPFINELTKQDVDYLEKKIAELKKLF